MTRLRPTSEDPFDAFLFHISGKLHFGPCVSSVAKSMVSDDPPEPWGLGPFDQPASFLGFFVCETLKSVIASGE